MQIVMDASKNEKYLKEHGELFENAEEDVEESSSVRKRQVREVYIPPEEVERLLEVYSHVVVQDFEDEYHMSKEERDKMRETYDKFFRLKRGFTKKIRKLDKYVEACRLCMDIIEDTAETNGIYDPDKFKAMVLNGQATINGLNFPKFQGKGKKNINWEYVAEFILDKTRDVRELVDREQLSEDSLEIDEDDLFTEEELEEILRPLSDEELYIRSGIALNPEDAAPGAAMYMSKKDRKELIKVFPSYIKTMKSAKKSISNRKSNSMVWQLDQDQLQFIQEYDAKIQGKKSTEPPKFKGDASKQSDVDAYLYAMDQWEKEHTLVEYNGRYITLEEMEDIRVKELLESSGWNLRNLYDNKDRAKRIQKAKENDKKRIKQLKDMLAEIQKRSDARDAGEDVDSNKGNKVNKKKKKKGKKGKKKAKKFDQIILDAVGADDENMQLYKKRMENMEWGD